MAAGPTVKLLNRIDAACDQFDNASAGFSPSSKSGRAGSTGLFDDRLDRSAAGRTGPTPTNGGPALEASWSHPTLKKAMALDHLGEPLFHQRHRLLANQPFRLHLEAWQRVRGGECDLGVELQALLDRL